MKLGIAGSGMIVQELLTFISKVKGIEVTAIFGRAESVEKLERLKHENHIQKIYHDYDAMCGDDGIDTIYVALPNHLHYFYVKQALLKEKNVICEKPFTSDEKELNELIRIADEKELFLLEAITNQYQSVYGEVKKQLDQIGDVKIVECNYSQYSSRYDRFKQGEVLPVFDYKQSGGALMDINIYNIHIAAGLFGKPRAVFYFPNIERNVDTSGILILEYPCFKCVCIGAKDSQADSFVSIQGDKGWIKIHGATNNCQSATVSVTGESEKKCGNEQSVHRMYEEFVSFEAIIRNQDTETSKAMLEHSRIVMQIVDEAKRAEL